MTLTEEDQVNGDKLRQLREERGWDWAQIARLSSLSVSQVRALETGSMDCFYTLKIKNNAARKVARVFGVAEAEVISVSEPTALPLEEVPLAHINPVPALRRAPHFHATTRPASWLGYGAMTLALVVGLAWHSLQPSTSTSAPAWVTTAASATLPEPAVPQSVQKVIDPAVNSAAVVANAAVAIAKANPAAVAAPLQVARAPGELEMTPASLNTPAEPTCAFDAHVAVMQAKNPTKSAEQISLMPRQAGALCVQDGTGKVWRQALKPGAWSTFNGQAPWKLYSAVLPGADVFFQGEKIRPVSDNAHTIALSGKLVIH